MKLFLAKKGSSETWWYLVAAILAILVVVVVAIWFTKSGEKGFSSVEDQIDGFADFDYDDVANFLDKCPCTPVGISEDDKLSGCPLGTNEETASAEQKKFREGNCPKPNE